MTAAADRDDHRRVCRRRSPCARGGPRRRRAARRERVSHHAVPQLGDQRSRPTSTAARWRTGRASCVEIVKAIRRACRRRLPPADEDQRHRVTPTRSSCRPGTGGQHHRGIDPGLPMARRGGRGRDSRVERRFFPHPKNPAGVDLPLEDLAKSYDTLISSGERTFRNFLLFRNDSRLMFAAQWKAPRGDSRPDRGPQPAGCAPHQGGRQRPGHLHWRVPDRIGHPRGNHGGDCDAVSIARPLIANPTCVEQFSSGSGPRRQAVHLLQSLPRQRRRESARMLRRDALSVARRDGDRDHVGVRSSGVPLNRGRTVTKTVGMTPSRGRCHEDP